MKKSTKPFLLFLFCAGLLALSSCKKADSAPLFDFTTPPIDLQGASANFVADLAYDDKALTKFDIFIPNSFEPTGLVLFIHGGGFAGGKKEDTYGTIGAAEIREYLKNNIAFATINYRLLDSAETVGVTKCLNDSKRALQYIRSRAADFNIDKDRIVLTGVSAGAGTAQWLAFNNDMADTKSTDPVLSQSTRVKAIAVKETQATYDLVRWTDDVFIDYGIPFALLKNSYSKLIAQFYGLPNLNEFDSAANVANRDKVDMLDLLTADDPEFYVENVNQPVAVPTTLDLLYHHGFHARELKKRADKVGVKAVVYYGKPQAYGDASGEKYNAFVIRKIKQ